MKKVFNIQANSFILFVEYTVPILILGSIFLALFDKFIALQLRDAMFPFAIMFLAIVRGVYNLINNKCTVIITDESLTI